MRNQSDITRIENGRPHRMSNLRVTARLVRVIESFPTLEKVDVVVPTSEEHLLPPYAIPPAVIDVAALRKCMEEHYRFVDLLQSYEDAPNWEQEEGLGDQHPAFEVWRECSQKPCLALRGLRQAEPAEWLCNDEA